MDPRRSQRLSEALREELEELIGYELSDPRIQISGITEILLSPDGKKAQVRLSLDGSPEQQEATLDALEHARSYLRREVGQRLQLFRVPDLHFEPDKSAELASRMSHLLRRVRKGRPREEAAPDEKNTSE